MYRNLVDADRRLVVLRFLSDAPGNNLNDSVMQSMLGQVGHSVSRDQVRNDFRWLEEQRLITVDQFNDGRVMVALLTVRGSEAARGLITVEGVKRPGPGG